MSLPKLAKNIEGQRFGKLIAIEYAGSENGFSRWLCQCDCGQRKVMRTNAITTGKSKSCGCERDKKRFQKTHGMTDSPEFGVWHGMKERCERETDPSYSNYGGRGVYICERWQVFENFYADMGPRPSKSHSIDRIDNDGPYAPDNCRWATLGEQGRNRRNNRMLTFNGETHCLAEWAEKIGITDNNLHLRLLRGWSLEKALTTPPGPRSFVKNKPKVSVG